MDEDKFAPRVEGTKTEKTGNRNTAYSLWHRSLGAEYFAVDIDFVEYRKDKGIVAFLAVTNELKDERHINNSKRFIWERTKLEREILQILSGKMGVPSYFVIHDDTLSIFHVHTMPDIVKFQRMTQEEYGKFIKSL